MRHIDVVRVPGASNVDAFRVTVSEDGGSTEHAVRVTAPAPTISVGYPSLEAFVEASFQFLLEREAKESILPSFEIREIGRYFPEWESALAR